MNENINLCEILKGLEGIELYSTVLGTVFLEQFYDGYLAVRSKENNNIYQYHKSGKYREIENAECTLFPSKDQRDWSEFERPIPIDTPMMVSNDGKDWKLRYYYKLIPLGHLVYSWGEKSNSNSATDKYIAVIPFDKFNPNDIEESLKYNIQKR